MDFIENDNKVKKVFIDTISEIDSITYFDKKTINECSRKLKAVMKYYSNRTKTLVEEKTLYETYAKNNLHNHELLPNRK